MNMTSLCHQTENTESFQQFRRFKLCHSDINSTEIYPQQAAAMSKNQKKKKNHGGSRLIMWTLFLDMSTNLITSNSLLD